MSTFIFKCLYTLPNFYHICGQRVCVGALQKETAACFSLFSSSSLFFLILFLFRLCEREREREMGNCQAIDAAALVIQHPDGKIERLYWPVTASEVMKMNPGHYVSLIIPLAPSQDEENQEVQKVVRFTRVKLLRPSDTLALGHAYKLVTSQEVMKVLRAKKYAKTKRQQLESAENTEMSMEKQSSGREPGEKSDTQKTYQGTKHERHGMRTASVNSTAMRPKSWRPSLQSISEASSPNINMMINGPQKAC